MNPDPGFSGEQDPDPGFFMTKNVKLLELKKLNSFDKKFKRFLVKPPCMEDFKAPGEDSRDK